MEIQEPKDYNIFSALIETIHNKDRKKLRFVKCNKCGRVTPFRLASLDSTVVKCKNCGNQVYSSSSK